MGEIAENVAITNSVPPLRIGTLIVAEPILLAPMAGHTDSCMRRMARRCGAGLVFTEMISAAALVRNNPRSLDLLSFDPEEIPLGVQLFGSDPGVLADAARLAQDRGASLIDINMGCPVPKVCRGGSGAALLGDPVRAARLFEAVRKVLQVPLTVKMRLGWDERKITAPEIARVAEESGVDAITLHPRTRSQGFAGTADWSWVRRLRQDRGIPVIGNGDVAGPQTARDALLDGCCNAVMIGRAARGNPWIFCHTRRLLAGEGYREPGPEERRAVVEQHLELVLARYGSERGATRIRLLLPYYLKGYPGAAASRRQTSLLRTGGAREYLGLLRAVLGVG
ncbi:MAG: tRNA dihydrouridine synthase DusB [bacterium]